MNLTNIRRPVESGASFAADRTDQEGPGPVAKIPPGKHGLHEDAGCWCGWV